MGGGKGGSAPTPPDPYTTANAMQQYGQNTAAYNAALNRYNVTTPYGSQTWSVNGGGGGSAVSPTAGFGFGSGSRKGVQPIGSGSPTGGAPQYSETVSLAPAQQQLLNSQNAQNLALSGGAMNGLTNSINQNASGGVPDFASSRKQAQDALYQNESQYLDPQFQQQGTLLASQLANEGVTPGTEAYDNAMKNFNLAKQSAYSNAQNQAISGATQQEGANIQNWSQLQNQPINELAALRSNTQIQSPNFQQPGSTNMQAPDVGQYINNAYQGQLAGYNAQQQSNNAMTGGLFGLGGAVAGALPWASWLSDARTKKDVKRIGKTKAGLPIYEFTYLGSDEPQIGVMAQEALEKQPNAVVVGDDGYLRVNYSQVR
jgi:hypothetical protein